jgi:hypothetical protein
MLFPDDYIYYFNEDSIHVHYKVTPNRLLKYGNRILLGHFLKSETYIWDGKKIEDGISMFEYGYILFPYYKNIFICHNKQLYESQYHIQQ